MSELAVEALSVGFPAGGGSWTNIVRRASLRLVSGEAVGLVGESGSGKSLTARAILGLLPPGARILAGTVLLDGQDLLQLDEEARRRSHGKRIGFVFQEPTTALNPVLTIGSQLGELLRIHQAVPRREVRRRAVELLSTVALQGADEALAAYPHQLSGGQKQRALLALALAARPDFLIADEPTTALDVTVQAQILGLLSRLRHELGLGLLLISHDLAVVAGTCSRAYVLYCGEVVEEGGLPALFGDPAHPYTRGLLAAQPRLGQTSPRGRMPSIPGQVPEPTRLPVGCPFHPRCSEALARCAESVAPWVNLGKGRFSRCHLHRDEGGGG